MEKRIGLHILTLVFGVLTATNAYAVKEMKTYAFGAARTAIDPLAVKENTKTGSTGSIIDVQTPDAQA